MRTPGVSIGLPFPRPAPTLPLAGLAAASVLALSVVVGIFVVSRPLLAALPVAALLGAWLLVDGRARLVAILFGGFFVLQGSEDLTTTKIAFLGVAAVAFVGAALNVWRQRATPAWDVARPLFAVSAVMLALIVVSLPVAELQGTFLRNWLRDATPYALFATVPFFAVDAQASLSRKGLLRVLVAFSLLGGAAFAAVWMQRRGIAYLPVARIGLASVFIPAVLFSLAMTVALQGWTGRIRAIGTSALILAMLVATGTRTTLSLLAAPLAIAAASVRLMARRVVRLALIAPALLVLTGVLAFVVVEFTDADATFLQKRIELLASSADSGADASYNDRLEQGRVALQAFRASPVFGVGPGYVFEWTFQGGWQVQSFVLDTPLTFVAKFGLIGLAVLLFVVARTVAFVRALARNATSPGGFIAYLTLVGYLAVSVVLSLFAPPFEDKGFSYGLILALAFSLHSLRDTAGAGDPASRSA